MRIVSASVLCAVLTWAFPSYPETLTARQYHPSAIEASVTSTVQSMEKANQPLQAEVEYLRKMLQDHPNETAIHRIYQDLMRRDSLDALREEYRKLADANPDNAVYAYLCGRIAATAEDRWRWAARAIRCDPNYYWGHLLMGYHFLNMAPTPNIPKAEEEFLCAVEIDNSISAGFANLASLYRTQADTAKTIEMYRLASVCEPDNFDFVQQRVNLLRVHDLNRAVAETKDFLSSHADHQGALITLRYFYYLQGNYSEALAAAQKLMAFGTPDADQWYDLATAYAMAHQPDSAFQALDKAIAMGWNDLQYLNDDPDLESLRQESRWAQTKQKIQNELDRTAPERQKVALKDVQNIPAPDFSFPDMDGNTVSLKDFRGKVVVLDFWALW